MISSQIRACSMASGIRAGTSSLPIISPKQKNSPWKIPASKAFRRSINGSKVLEALSARIINSGSNKIRMQLSIQMMMAGIVKCLAIRIPPARGMRTRIKGAFLNALSNIAGYWKS
jgi:hypothetical protein